jgi:ABC-type antimicrobial peptide transport system permease subunit
LNSQSVAAELVDAVGSLDPTIPIQTATLKETVYALAERPRFSATLLLLFAGLAVLLAAAGIYGLVSLLVTQRTQEIAIRIALGASPTVLSREIVKQVCLLIVIGGVCGILCALPAQRLVGSLIFGIKPSDPLTLAEAVLGLLLVAIVAALVPAYRAAKVDPMVALRYE